MEKIKLLLVVKNPVGGIRTFLLYTLRYFSQAKYDISIIMPIDDNNLYETLIDKITCLSNIENVTCIPLEKNITNKDFFIAVSKHILTKKYNIIWSHGFTSAVISVWGAFLKRTCHIITLHDIFLSSHNKGIKGFFIKISLFFIVLLSDRIHLVSNGARENFQSFCPFYSLFRNKIKTINNGVEVGRFNNYEIRNLRKELTLDSKAFLIGFFGRFMSQKGFKYLRDAVELLINDKDINKQIYVISFGWNGFIREEQIEIKNRNLDNLFKFLPFVENISATLKGLDLVVMPSLWEACSLLPMETMIAGVPLIGTSCIGLGELIEGSPNKIVPPANSNCLARAIKDELLNSTCRKAQAYSEIAKKRFDVIPRAKEIEDMMLTVLTGKCMDRPKYPGKVSCRHPQEGTHR